MADCRSNQPHRTHLVGQAGVWQVASQLALRGLNPHFPGVDFGYDLMVENGIRIQVKAASLRHNARVYPEGAYWFKFWQSNILSGNNNVRIRGARDYSKVSDFLVLWGVTENRFWIVPSSLLAQTQSVVIPASVIHMKSERLGTVAAKIRRLENAWDQIGALVEQKEFGTKSMVDDVPVTSTEVSAESES